MITLLDKGKNGVFHVAVEKGRLLIRIPRKLYEGKQKRFWLHLPATPENYAKAYRVAHQMNIDYLDGQFNYSLTKYRNMVLPALEVVKPVLTVAELWEKYCRHKQASWSETYIRNQIHSTTNKICLCPYTDVSEAKLIRNWLMENYSLDAAKRVLVQLGAMAKWAERSGAIASNPFHSLSWDVKPRAAKEDDDINPFTLAERNAIIAAVEQNQFSRFKGKHSQYAAYLKFLFFTGARTSEALALKWENLKNSCICFEEAYVLSRGKMVKRKRLKTQKRRLFPVNKQLIDLFDSIERVDQHIFTLPDGKPINHNAFRLGCWKTVLAKLGLEYRKPYQTRHTFITLAINEGNMRVHDVARLVGNSPEVIYRNYLGTDVSGLFVPEL